MFIGSIGFQRATVDEYKTIGQVWYDKENHHCSLLMNGFRQGQAFSKPYDYVSDPPYLNGDIKVFAGVFGEGLKKKYLWCGFVWTESNQYGCIYQFMFEVDPSPLLVCKQIEDYDKCVQKGKEFMPNKQGIFVSVHLTDKE